MLKNALHPQPVDMVGEYAERLPLPDLQDLQSMLNVNTSDEADQWLDEEIPTALVEIIDEDAFFDRYFGDAQ